MTFADPYLLTALVVVPLAVVVYVVFARRGRRAARAAANPALWPNLMPRRPGWRRHVPPVLLLLALACCSSASARPQAHDGERPEADDGRARRRLVELDGGHGRPPEPHRGRPHRGARSHQRASRRTRRLGLVSFARDVHASCRRPPTDRAAFSNALAARLTLRGGTTLGTAIDRAVASLRASHPARQGARDHRDLGRQEHRGHALADRSGDARPRPPACASSRSRSARPAAPSRRTASTVTVPPDPTTLRRVAADQRRALLPRHRRQGAAERLPRHRQRGEAAAQEARHQLRLRRRRHGPRGRRQPALAGLVPPPALGSAVPDERGLTPPGGV